MVSNAMRQLEERHMATKVDLMVWSNKMDLLALSNAKGEVTLHRLSWQKVWSLSPPVEDLLVTGIAWRPDGKVIAISYTNNVVLLVDVENKDILDRTEYTGGSDPGGGGGGTDGGSRITCLAWPEEKGSLTGTSYNNAAQDNASTYLPKLPPISRSFGSISEESNEVLEDTKKVMDQTNLNFLLVGTTDGRLSISVFGLFKCGLLKLPQPASIIAADISADLKNIFLVTVDQSGNLSLVIYDTDIIASYCRELHALAYKHGQLMSLMDYLESTVQAVTEAYENMLLLEMESKLSQYTDSTEEGAVSADFLELLMFGIASDDLAAFLLQDLTDKGIKKLGNSIELSHSNIQKLILKHVQAVGQNIAYHLSELRGMARLTERFQALGIDETRVAHSFTETGAFLVKASEVQSVIDDSMKKYKALFKWLYSVIVRVSDDRVAPPPPPPPDLGSLPEISQQETAFIADYLYRLTELPDNPPQNTQKPPSGKRHCYLDRLGQYMADSDLVTTVPLDPWEQLLRENPQLAKHPSIITRNQTASLVQQHNKLKHVIEETFTSAEEAVGSKITVVSTTDMCRVDTARLRVTMMHIVEESKLLVAFIGQSGSDNVFTYMEISAGTPPASPPAPTTPDIIRAQVFFKSGDVDLKTVDLEFYTSETISVLLEEPGDERCAVFVQMPVRGLRPDPASHAHQSSLRVDAVGWLEAGALRRIDNMVGCRLAVSGARKVAVLLSESMHKVRTFEMEVEEDEEEEDMDTTRDTSTNTTPNNS